MFLAPIEEREEIRNTQNAVYIDLDKVGEFIGSMHGRNRKTYEKCRLSRLWNGLVQIAGS